jgi:preprotein translocase subunit SecG
MSSLLLNLGVIFTLILAILVFIFCWKYFGSFVSRADRFRTSDVQYFFQRLTFAFLSAICVLVLALVIYDKNNPSKEDSPRVEEQSKPEGQNVVESPSDTSNFNSSSQEISENAEIEAENKELSITQDISNVSVPTNEDSQPPLNTNESIVQSETNDESEPPIQQESIKPCKAINAC